MHIAELIVFAFSDNHSAENWNCLRSLDTSWKLENSRIPERDNRKTSKTARGNGSAFQKYWKWGILFQKKNVEESESRMDEVIKNQYQEEVEIVKEVISCDILPVAMVFATIVGIF